MNRRRNLWTSLVASAVLLLWLMPIVGSTANGGETFLLHFMQALGVRSTISDSYIPYHEAANVGVGLCFALGFVMVVCIFQLVRLWVRKRLH